MQDLDQCVKLLSPQIPGPIPGKQRHVWATIMPANCMEFCAVFLSLTKLPGRAILPLSIKSSKSDIQLATTIELNVYGFIIMHPDCPLPTLPSENQSETRALLSKCMDTILDLAKSYKYAHVLVYSGSYSNPRLDSFYNASLAPTTALLNVLMDDTSVLKDEDHIALILQTSGTTGRPKLVPLRARHLAASIKNIISAYSLTPRDTCYVVMPLFHVHGLIGCFLASYYSGGKIVLPWSFSASNFIDHLAKFKCTWTSAVPTIYQMMLERYSVCIRGPMEKAGGSLPHLRFLRSCSSALPIDTFDALQSAFHVPVIQAYAMTEAAHQMTFDRNSVRGSVGVGCGDTIVRVADLSSSAHSRNIKWLGPDQVGEVCVAGSHVIDRGYLIPANITGSEERALAHQTLFGKNFIDDQQQHSRIVFLRTGDLGRLDSKNNLYIVGRLGERITRGGEKIDPLEVDSILLAHPRVAEVCCFGISDRIWGQRIQAAVVWRNDGTIIADEQKSKELKSYCLKRTVPFKVPDAFYFLSMMPKSGTGKIQRKHVAASVLTLDSKI